MISTSINRLTLTNFINEQQLVKVEFGTYGLEQAMKGWRPQHHSCEYFFVFFSYINEN